MANSGYTDVYVTKWDTLRFSWEQTGQSIENNCTYINWTLKLIAGSSGRISSSASKSWSVNIDGNAYSGTTTVGIGNNSEKTLAYGGVTIYHNADGNKSFSYSFSQYFGIKFSGSSIGTISGSGSGDLNYIARASQPSCITYPGTTQNVGNLGSGFTIHMNRASGSFTHTVKYNWGNKSGTIATGVTNNCYWTLPKNFAENVPNGTSGWGEIIVDTYNGGTYIGTKKVSFTATIPDTEDFKPKITDIALSENSQSGVPSDWGFYVQNKSKLTYNVASSGVYNSTIKAYQVTVNGLIYYTKSDTTNALLLAGTNTISATVTDSRGRTKTFSKTFEVVEYGGPKLNTFKTIRCNEDGTENDEGSYVKIDIDASIPSLSDKNTYTYSLKSKQRNETEYTSQELEIEEQKDDTTISLIRTIVLEADPDISFDYLFAIADNFNEITRISSIETAFQLMNFNSSGKGMAVGKVSEKDAFEVGMDIYDQFGQLIHNGLAEYGDGSIDANETLSHLCLAQYNTPNNSFYYVMTLFYGTKSTTANRIQIAVPYIYDASQNKKDVFIRQYVDGTWNNWYSPSKGVTLYDNSSGTNGTVTLSESAANFSSLDICYKSRYSERNSIKVYEPEGKIANLSMFRVFPRSGTDVGITRLVRISGTSIFTYVDTGNDDMYGEWWSYDNHIANENNMYILKVIGYR